jgi:hypothetical protein
LGRFHNVLGKPCPHGAGLNPIVSFVCTDTGRPFMM